MAGLILDDLELLTNIENDSNFLLTLSGDSYRVQGVTFYNTFSGVKEATSLGFGIPVYEQYIDLVDGRIGTSLQFNSISASDGLYAILDQSTIKIGLSSGTISVDKIQDNSITTNKIALSSITSDLILDNSITTSKILSGSITTDLIADGSITPVKQSGTIYSIGYKTDTQLISAYTGSTVEYLSATVTPVSVNSVVLITGHLTLGLQYAGVKLQRTIDETTEDILLSDDYPNVSAFTFVFPKNSNDNNPTTGSINFLDIPNTSLPVTYTVYVESTSAYDTFVNKAYSEEDGYQSSRGSSQIAAVVLP